MDAPSDSDGDDEEQEHDEVLMDAATDLMPALAAALGPAYAPLFAEHFVPLWKFGVSRLLWSLISIVFKLKGRVRFESNGPAVCCTILCLVWLFFAIAG